MKLQKNLEHLKNFDCLKLHLNYNKKNGVLALKTISEATISKAGGYGYDKRGTVFKEFFLKLGFNVEDVCYSEFDLFDNSVVTVNEFLKNNNINYKVIYRTEINNNISFIELNKIQ